MVIRQKEPKNSTYLEIGEATNREWLIVPHYGSGTYDCQSYELMKIVILIKASLLNTGGFTAL